MAATSVPATLADGLQVVLRPITPGDKELLVDGMQHLSDRSRYLRFFSGVHGLSEQALRYFTEIDYVDHFAWVATRAGCGDDDPGLGVARYIRTDRPEAEVAVAVVDEAQGRGLGTLLFDALVVAASENGIEALCASVLPENRAMQALLRRAGLPLAFDRQLGVLSGCRPVTAFTTGSLPAEVREALRAAVARVRPPQG